jgi:PAS domain S-box-containing protein
MEFHTATGLNRSVKSADARTSYAGRFNIGPRLTLGFVLIILAMLAADVVVLWQFHLVRNQAERLNGIDEKLVDVLRVHTSLLAFHDRLEELADDQDASRLVTEGAPLRTAVLDDTRRAISALSLPPFDPQRHPTILPTLYVIQSTLPSQFEAITTLATSGDWQAVHLRLTNQVTPLNALTSSLVEAVDREVGEEQAQTVRNITRVQRIIFVVVPLTAAFTLLIAAALGATITRSITQPLARLVEGSKALARGEFQHQVSITGKDELAHLGLVFNDTARRLLELYATLQNSEARLRLVIDTIPANAWSAWPDGSVDFVNQRFLEFTGRSIKDMLGWGWGAVVHPDDFHRFVGAWQAAVATGEPMEAEARIQRMDGVYRWLLIRNVPLRDELGKIVNWYGTAIDIEERKQAEYTLRRSEAYLAEAQTISRTGSFGWRPKTGEITWSEETFRIFRYERTITPSVELVLQRVHPEDKASVQETIRRASQEGKDFEHEYRLLMQDGVVKHVHVVGHAEKNDSGELEFVGAVMDITERTRAEALRDAESRILERIARDARLEEILESLVRVVEAQFPGMLCSVLLLDEDGQHIRNSAAPNLPESYVKALNGLPIGPTAGSCGTAMYRRELVVVTDILQDALWEPYRALVQPYGLRACWSTPILAHSGEPLGSFAMYYLEPRSPSAAEIRALEMATHLAGIAIQRRAAREGRERLRQAQADLARVNRVTTLGELTASLAHEVNQPIAAAVTSANSCIRWLAADVPNLEKARAAAARIARDGTRAAEIISRIRLLFQKGSSQWELVNVNEVIEEMIVLLRGEATRYSISIRTELEADLPPVRGDRVQLQQVMMNLMTNGIDAMKDVEGRRELAIKSQRSENGQLLVSVSDTGVGLPQQAEQIFDAFFTTKPHGTGMGLRICRSIAEAHGGRLWAANCPSRGASFYFTLPMKSEARE